MSVNLQIQPLDWLIKPTATVELSEGYFSNIESCVGNFFQSQECGIVIYQNQYSDAIFNDNADFYIFASYLREPKWFAASEKETSMLMRFTIDLSLYRHILIVLQAQNLRDL